MNYVGPSTNHSTVTPRTRARRTAVTASSVACRPLSRREMAACDIVASRVLAASARARIDNPRAMRVRLMRRPRGVAVGRRGVVMGRVYVTARERLHGRENAFRLRTMGTRTGRPPLQLPSYVVTAYVEGETSDSIAARAGCSRGAILGALRRAGVTVRRGGTVRRNPPKPPRVQRTAEDRFWSFVDRRDDGCWQWLGGTCKGYGTFTVKSLGKSFRAHRFAYALAHGAIPDGLHVLHRCDNPPCVNPEHLFLGTHLENVADMVAKGRGAKGDRSGARLHPERCPRGERSGMAKLTAAQVDEIRATPRRRGGQHQLALRFGVSDATISMILNGKVWASVSAQGARP